MSATSCKSNTETAVCNSPKPLRHPVSRVPMEPCAPAHGCTGVLRTISLRLTALGASRVRLGKRRPVAVRRIRMVAVALCLPVSPGTICPAAQPHVSSALLTTTAPVALRRRLRAPAAPLLQRAPRVPAPVCIHRHRLRRCVRRGSTWIPVTTRVNGLQLLEVVAQLLEVVAQLRVEVAADRPPRQDQPLAASHPLANTHFAVLRAPTAKAATPLLLRHRLESGAATRLHKSIQPTPPRLSSKEAPEAAEPTTFLSTARSTKWRKNGWMQEGRRVNGPTRVFVWAR